MLRALLIVCGFCIFLGACTQRMVCPAYQSAYIYDQDALRKKFSYFKEDSTPKIFTASKNKYLIAEPTSLRKKTREMRTVPAKAVQPVVPDSISGKGDKDLEMSDFSMAEVEIIDSIAVGQQAEAAADSAASAAAGEDSVYMISKDREVRVLRYNFPDSLKYDPVLDKYVPEKPYYYIDEVGFNMEQNHYMWYLRDFLVLPDVKLAQAESGKDGEQAASGKKKKGGFFKNLFKRKKKKKDQESLVEEQDDTAGEEEETIDFKDLDSPDTTATSAPPPPVPTAEDDQKPAKVKKEKKKKEKKVKPKKKKKSDEEIDPAEKKEDDGF